MNIEFNAQEGALKIHILVKRTHFDERAANDFARRLDGNLCRILKEPQATFTHDGSVTGSPPATPYATTAATTPQPPESPVDSTAIDKLLQIVAATAEMQPAQIDPMTTQLVTLGLDSVIAIRICQEARKQGIQITVRDVIDGKTCFGIAARAPAATHSSTPSLARSNDLSGPISILPGQHFQLAAALLSASESGVYVFAWQMDRQLQQERVSRAWSTLIQEQEILRGRFAAGDQDQIIISFDANPQEPQFHSISDASIGGVRAAIAHLNRAATRPNSAQLHHLQPADHAHGSIIVLRLSHALYDSQSFSTMSKRLIELLLSSRQSSPTYAPSFSTIAQAARALASSDQSQAYWKQAIAKVEATLLGPNQVASVGKVEFTWIRDILEDVSKVRTNLLRARSPVTLQSLIIAAWAKVLAAATRRSSSVVGFLHAGRSSSVAQIDEAPGPCSNVLPVMVQNAATGKLLDLALAVQSDLDQRRDFEQVSLPELCGWLGRKPDSRLFDTVLNILWDSVEPKSPDQAFEQVDLGPPSDYYHDHEKHEELRALLKRSPLVPHAAIALNIDVVYNKGTDSVDLAFKYTTDVVKKHQVEAFASDISKLLLDHLNNL